MRRSGFQSAGEHSQKTKTSVGTISSQTAMPRTGIHTAAQVKAGYVSQANEIKDGLSTEMALKAYSTLAQAAETTAYQTLKADSERM